MVCLAKVVAAHHVQGVRVVRMLVAQDRLQWHQHLVCHRPPELTLAVVPKTLKTAPTRPRWPEPLTRHSDLCMHKRACV